MAVSIVGLVATVGMNFNVLIPPLAQDVLGVDAAGYGFLMTASGIGALGAAVALVIGGKPRPFRIALGGIVLGVASVLLALSSSFPLSLVLMVFVGGRRHRHGGHGQRDASSWPSRTACAAGS